MAIAHRIGDLRTCTAVTVPGLNGQSFVKIGGKAWAVAGDWNSHGEGELVPGLASFVTINGTPVIVVGDTALPDLLCGEPPFDPEDCTPFPITGSSLVNVT